jgi:phosphoserine aminotransferase
MQRKYNFSAGPAMLPASVMEQAQAEMLDWHDTGMSIMEVSHRGLEFKEVAEQAEHDLRELMAIPANYQVLFLPGGASTQFAMVPLNLLNTNTQADYVDTGIWSKKAIQEAKKYGEVNVVTELGIENDLMTIPPQTQWQTNPNAAYLHYTPNETITGVEFAWVPQTGDVPLVADMTSFILSRPVDVSQFGIIYAGAQKNIGQAGLNIVIIRDDLITPPSASTPSLYNYQLLSEHKSLYNTPPTYAWYMAGLVLAWVKKQGGVKAFAELNSRKAGKLYAMLDQNKNFYSNFVHPSCRSLMNVTFNLTNANLTADFLAQADLAGLSNLRGHQLVGGIRASIYNAMPDRGVDTLIEFMQYFMEKNS